ncbi:MAG: FlgD immunoglobulin-like domain containing protein, partial [candidate division WOR-3 bacterium]
RAGATTGGFAYGGALYIDSANALVFNNTFFANMCSTAIPYGGAIYVKSSKSSVIKNNIIVGNIATGIVPYGGGIACQPDTLDTLIFDYNDVWGNLPNNYYACRPGPHAFSLDPLFVSGPSGEYYLSQIAAGQPEESPCVDAGDTLLMTSPLNLDSLIHRWTTRSDTVYDTDRIDLGYHYLPTPFVSIKEKNSLATVGERFLIFPNPTSQTISIFYSLSRESEVKFSIYDGNGRLVRELIGKRGKAGTYRLFWDGKDSFGRRTASGIYFLSFNGSRVKKLLKLK